MTVDTTAKDALARSIATRLLMCDEAEVRALDRMLVSIEKRRDILTSASEPIKPASAELRDSMTYKPRPRFTVIDGGEG